MGERVIKMCRILNIQETYYLILLNSVTPEKILRAVEENSHMRKKSMADYYTKKIMHGILNCAINLCDKYEKYYKEEYNTFNEFLYKKELIDEFYIKKISLKDSEILWKLNFSSNDYSIKSLIGYENENLVIINQILGDIVNEN